MWTAVLSIIAAAVKALVGLMNLLHERQLIETGCTQAQAESIKGQLNDLQTAISVRAAVRAEHIRDPSSIMRHDDDERPE